MAEKPKTPAAKSKQTVLTPPEIPEAPQSKFGLVFKIVFVALALCILVAIGFAAGVYLKMIDVEKITKDINLSQNPVVGRFLPKTNFEPVELEEDTENIQIPPGSALTPNHTQQPVIVPPAEQLPNDNIITKEDLEKQAKLRQKEEAKRISKLARLYGEMKPDAAVAIMKELDDPTIVAIFNKMEEEQVSKILALFESRRAARITENMLKGQVQPPSL